MKTALLLVAVLASLTLPTAQMEGPTVTPMLLDESAHKAAVKASYQTNVKTIYFHLEEIIKKILAHKTKWTNKYNGDLAKIAAEVLKHKNVAKQKEKKYMAAKGKAEAAKAMAKTKNKSWQKAKNKLKQTIKDAKKQKKGLKDLYIKGLKQKEGEICMIRKIECMVAKFNGEADLQAKYCGACKEKTPSSSADNGGEWVKGANGATCDATCKARGKTCDVSELNKLTSNAKVGAAFKQAGYTCKGYHAPRNYPGTPFSTARSDDCAPVIPGKTVTCSGNSHGHHAALCYCK